MKLMQLGIGSSLLAAIILIPLSFGQGRTPVGDPPTPAPDPVPECQGEIPGASTSTKFGDTVSCGENIECEQNYSIDFSYTCNVPAPTKQCAPGEVLLSKIYTWKCHVNGDTQECQANTVRTIKGPGMVAKDCPAEGLGGDDDGDEDGDNG